jgi:hypothetical protein
MTIKFNELREPMSFLARMFEGEGVSLATSDASDRLTEAIRRYVAGKSIGRAFLIAGHRGAGKSTLVYNAIHQCRREARDKGERYPLLVRLNGPTLLDPVMTIPPVSTGSTATEGTAATSPHVDDSRAKSETRTFLSQLTIALYKSLVRELIDRLRSPNGTSKRPWAEDSELIASLQIELDEIPAEARLRGFWSRFTALKHGVLGISSRPTAAPVGPGQRVKNEQGMLELVALASAARAYREVIYDIHVSLNDSNTNQLQANANDKPDANGHALSSTVLAIAGAGTLTTGAGIWAGNSVLAVCAAIASAAVATFGLTRSRNASSTVTRSTTTAYQRDPDREANLGRILPDLLDRIQAAGLVPIFVVDELDKIAPEQVDERIGNLLDRAKLFVTDAAFFCYIVDRAYLDLLKAQLSRGVYPKGYTFFSDVLLASLTPESLHSYLSAIVQVEGSDTHAAEILNWMLLHWARMHPIDLRREIERITRPDRTVRLSANDIQSRTRHRYDVQMQVIVQHQLNDESLRARCDREPDFVRFAYDALYFASRRWEAGDATLDASQDAIIRYLRERLRSDTRKTDAGNGHGRIADYGAACATKAAADGAADLPDLPITERDTELLVRHAQKVVEYLSDPAGLKLAVGDSVPPHVAKMLPEETPLLVSAGGDTYRWTYDFSGLFIADDEVPTQRPDESDFALVEQFARLLRDAPMTQHWNVDPEILARRSLLTSRLELGSVLKTLPLARSEPDTVRTRQGKADWKEACEHVTEYARDLRASLRSMWLGIYIANVLRIRARRPAVQSAMSASLEALQQSLQLATLTPEQREATLRAVAEGFPAFNPALPVLAPAGSEPVFGPFEELTAWKDAVDSLIVASEQTQVVSSWNEDAILRRAWESWQQRLTQHLLGDRVEPLEAANLLVGPTAGMSSLTLPLEEMTLVQWTTAASAGLSSMSNSDPFSPGSRLWLALPALVKLGFSGAARQLSEAVLATSVPPVDTDERRAFESVATILSRPTEGTANGRRVLVVSNDVTGAGPTRWKPDSEHAALVGERQKLATLLDDVSRLTSLPSALGIDLVMMDIPAGGTAARSREETRKAFTRYPEIVGLLPTRCVFLFKEKPADAGLLDGIRYSTNATSLREAIPSDL